MNFYHMDKETIVKVEMRQTDMDKEYVWGTVKADTWQRDEEMAEIRKTAKVGKGEVNKPAQDVSTA